MKKMKTLFVGAALALAMSGAFAAADPDAPSGACEGIQFATGPKGKGYSKLFANIQRVCGQRVSLCEVNTEGGLANLNALAEKTADVAIAQYDTWLAMKSDDSIASLELLMPLNSNYLHVVTSVNGFTTVGPAKFKFMKGDEKHVVINNFSDLRGQRVAAVGSAQLWIRQLDKQLGFGMNIIDVSNDNAAFAKVKSGEVAAAVSTSGWPSGPVGALTQADGLTLVPFNVSAGDAYKVKALNYRKIAVYNNNTLGTPNLLVTRPFSGQRAANVAALQSCMTNNMKELKEGNYEPGWNEVNLGTTVSGIAPFKAPSGKR